eukprot:CAMPEP_0172622542 /NCGR_PEP_ID=MMETSP1068-20121228/121213_1 /TAXON_ID=35684 /ORGANISM="Pseudopedinella elastica, Strain CCMP716" /LENGTH=235 /DNA_ID=CAMNT_0013430727 /DNA_START=28 /DNA_END=735 /DNA_ORIENTATION=-
MAGFVPSESILQLKGRTLRNQRTPMRGRPPPPEPAEEDFVTPLVDLYNKHSGDLVKMFEELEEDPGKALKYPPSSAEDFAAKYVVGKYTYVSNIEKIRAELQSKLEGDPELEEAMESVAPQELPEDMDDADTELHPMDLLKAMFPDVEEEVVAYFFEASGGNVEETAQSIWFMKVMQAFVKAGAKDVQLPKAPPEEMSVKELLIEIRENKLDSSRCIEKSELIALVKENRAKTDS